MPDPRDAPDLTHPAMNYLHLELQAAHDVPLRSARPSRTERATVQRQAHEWSASSGLAHGAAVSVRGVSRHFAGRPVLEGLDLDLAAGEFVAIVGRSGCGKSTLLRLLAGLDTADAGEITLDGSPAPAASRKRPPGDAVPHSDVRMMFQDARLLPWKRVLDNVALGLTGADVPARALAALAQVGLADRAQDWPAVLSGGQRQRVALARALVHAPRLLLDEPLGALDALTRIEMHQLIEHLWLRHGFTALLVTHDVSEAVALADRVVLIEDHRIGFDEPVTLPRPRVRGADFARLEERVLQRVLGQQDVLPLAPRQDTPIAASSLRWAI